MSISGNLPQRVHRKADSDVIPLSRSMGIQRTYEVICSSESWNDVTNIAGSHELDSDEIEVPLKRTRRLK